MKYPFFSTQALLLPVYKAKHRKELWGRQGLEEAQKNLILFLCACFCFVKTFVYVVAPDVSSRREQSSCRRQSSHERGISWTHCPWTHCPARGHPGKGGITLLSPHSSPGIHKPIPSADPADVKDSLATVVKSSSISAALP